jgi:hypothetical protein
MRPLLILTALSWLCACSSENGAPAPNPGEPLPEPPPSVEAPPLSQLEEELKPSAFQAGTALPASLKPPRP